MSIIFMYFKEADKQAHISRKDVKEIFNLQQQKNIFHYCYQVNFTNF